MKFNLFRRSRRQDEVTGYFHDETFSIMDESSLNEQKGWDPEKPKATTARKEVANKSATAKKAVGGKPAPKKASGAAAVKSSTSAMKKSTRPKAAAKNACAAPKKASAGPKKK